MASVTLRAFAKINLSLRITGVRPDGFHGVETILQAIDLCDHVTCEGRRGPFEIRCDTPGVPADRTNLVWKGAQILWQAAGHRGEPRDAMVTLHKKIPMQAGLGGGSSDAAAALLGLRRLWKVRVPDETIHRVASQLGSDVPFFLMGGTALGLGRGDDVYPLEDLPAYRVVLVFPPFGVPTADAYRWFDEAGSSGGRPTPKTALSPGWSVALANDLEPPVIARHPVIGRLKRRLAERGALVAAMSGSGSTVFGVFKTQAGANAAARALKADGATVLRARFLGRLRP